ncbi:AbiH family protein [Veillonella parvula]|uniref:bacteriophage abortive infection AbiH family protein n=1 Tax=Veillonella parvula TaxID=29466 RepID=UPI0028D68627|nr:AbiH family protein [Veillonella parvula]
MCANLWIIGNGFDIAHGLNTKYNNFKEFLNEYNPDLKNVLEDGCNDSDLLWSRFEEALGYLDYDYLLDVYRDEVDIGLDSPGLCAHNMIQTIVDIRRTLESLPDVLNEWISTIDVTDIDQLPLINTYMIDSDNYFINFNYTNTLECVYNIDYTHIYYIHGSQYHEDLLVLGHAGPVYPSNYDEVNGDVIYSPSEQAAIDFSMDELIELDDEKECIREMLRKDSHESLHNLNQFLERYGSQINRIISFGFSYGEADMLYIRSIINYFNNTPNFEWLLHDRNSSGQEKIITKLILNGFSGRVNLFY